MVDGQVVPRPGYRLTPAERAALVRPPGGRWLGPGQMHELNPQVQWTGADLRTGRPLNAMTAYWRLVAEECLR